MCDELLKEDFNDYEYEREAEVQVFPEPTGGTPEDRIQDLLNKTVIEMEHLNRKIIAGWICYLLEQIDYQAGDYALGILETVKESIETRIEDGQW
jgi:hypothetical protein